MIKKWIKKLVTECIKENPQHIEIKVTQSADSKEKIDIIVTSCTILGSITLIPEKQK